MPVVLVPTPLRERLGDEATDALIDLFNQVSDQTKEDVVVVVGERFERRLAEELSKVGQEISEVRAVLREEIAGLGAELRTEIAGLGAELRTEIAGLGTELRTEMASLRTDLARGQTEIIRWMFLFWIGQLAAILAILFTFFRK